jgi:hypothetical protein
VIEMIPVFVPAMQFAVSASGKSFWYAKTRTKDPVGRCPIDRNRERSAASGGMVSVAEPRMLMTPEVSF